MGNVARKQVRVLGGARGCEMSRRAVCKFLCVGVCAGGAGVDRIYLLAAYHKAWCKLLCPRALTVNDTMYRIAGRSDDNEAC